MKALEIAVKALEQIKHISAESEVRHIARAALDDIATQQSAPPIAQVSQVEQDAARYRYLRNSTEYTDDVNASLDDMLGLDSAIDAAIAATKGTKP